MPDASRTLNRKQETGNNKLKFSTFKFQASGFKFQVKRGFTLIELLIVMAILAVLAAVIMVSINPVKRKSQARDVTRKSDIGQLANALKAYYTTNDDYPSPSGLASVSGLTVLRASGDLKLIPLDPVGSEYQYLVSGSGVSSQAAIYGELEDPTSGSGNWVWCWRSESVSVGEITNGNCQP